MIYTVTLNPALDYVVQVNQLNIGDVNRTEHEIIYPGGKGINVSMVLKNLGLDSMALGFVAGFTGVQLIKELQQKEIRSDFISVEKGMTRINVKIKEVGADVPELKRETEVNGLGPQVSPLAVQVLIIQMERLKAGDVLVLSGSIPSSLPKDIYERLMKRLQGRGVRILVDTTGEALLNTLKFQPFLIKPNHHELGEIFGADIQTKHDAKVYARKLQAMGAKNVLVSMASEGAVMIDENGNAYESGAPKGVVENSVGAGDSMLAGFLAAYLETENYEQAFYMGVAAGSAGAFSAYLPERSQILKVFQENFG